MKFIYPVLTLAILTTVFSCTQSEEIPSKDADEIEKLIESSEVVNTFEVSVPEAKFEITFPVSNADKTISTQIIDGEEIAISHYSANMQGKGDLNLAYQIDYIFLPEIDTKEEIQELYNGQRDFILSASNSELEYEIVVEQSGVVGRQFCMTVDGSNLKINGEMYFKNGIFYKTVVVTDEGHLFNKKISGFLSSLKILD